MLNNFVPRIESAIKDLEPEEMAISIAIFQAVLTAKMLERTVPESRVELMRRSGIDRKTITKYLTRYNKISNGRNRK